MKKAAWLCLLLALALLLTGCAKDESKELEKSAVRVGNVVYTYGDLLDVEASTRSYYEQMAQLYAMYGMEAQMPTDAQLREEALNTLLWQAVVLDKADQMKLSTLTGAEQAEISARTDAAMADYRAQALELLALPEDTAEADKSAAVDAFLAESGVTREAVWRVERDNFIIDKTQAWAVADVKVTEAEFLAEYNEHVASAQSSYEADPFAYGMARQNGETAFYAPAGYREVEWLLVDYTETDMAAMSAIDNALTAAEVDAEAAETQVRELLGADADVDTLVAQVIVTLDEVTDPAAITVQETVAGFEPPLSEEATAALMRLAGARTLVSAYEEQLALAIDAAEAALAPEVAEILRRLENGEEWARVREHYNDDTSLLYGSPVVCQGFPYAPEGYVAKAMELAASGASDAVYVEGYGCFVIRYMAEVPQGPVAQDAVREHIMEELLTSKQQQSFSSTVNIWSDAAASRMIINYNLLGQ